MNPNDIVEFVTMVFGVGILFSVYFPRLWGNLLWIIAGLGVLYLFWGTIASVTNAVLGIGKASVDNWWAGVAILLLVMLIFGRADIAYKALYIMLALGIGLVTGVWSFIKGLT
jgi:hypothetical protein